MKRTPSRQLIRVVVGIVSVLIGPTAWLPAAAQPSAAPSEDAAARAVRATAAAIIAADNARDLDRVLALYTPDAVLMPPGEDPVIGRTAIRPRYETLFRTMVPAIQLEVTEVHVGGAWAFVRGRNTGMLRPVDGAAPPRRLNDLFVMILSHGTEGQWRIARLMWHAGPAR